MSMNQSKATDLTVAILDYDRPKEAEMCLMSIERFITCPHQLLYVSNGGDQRFARDAYESTDLIDTLILNRNNWGCGIGTKQAFQAALTEWVLYVQCDQFAGREFSEAEFKRWVTYLETHPDTLYVDLAGNQGHGRYSERAHLMRRDDYLDIPGLNSTIGGPGPYADFRWTEELVQEYMAKEGLKLISAPPVFGDNGKWSRREFPCGGITLHSTDEKKLFIVKPLIKRYDHFPNLKLNDAEWADVLDGKWPVDGRIPEADKEHSFICWPS